MKPKLCETSKVFSRLESSLLSPSLFCQDDIFLVDLAYENKNLHKTKPSKNGSKKPDFAAVSQPLKPSLQTSLNPTPFIPVKERYRGLLCCYGGSLANRWQKPRGGLRGGCECFRV